MRGQNFSNIIILIVMFIFSLSKIIISYSKKQNNKEHKSTQTILSETNEEKTNKEQKSPFEAILSEISEEKTYDDNLQNTIVENSLEQANSKSKSTISTIKYNSSGSINEVSTEGLSSEGSKSNEGISQNSSFSNLNESPILKESNTVFSEDKNTISLEFSKDSLVNSIILKEILDTKF